MSSKRFDFSSEFFHRFVSSKRERDAFSSGELPESGMLSRLLLTERDLSFSLSRIFALLSFSHVLRSSSRLCLCLCERIELEMSPRALTLSRVLSS